MSILIKSIETNNVRGRNVILFADLKSEVPTTGTETMAAIGENVKLNAGDVIYTAALEAAILDTNDEWDWDFGGGGSSGDVTSVNGKTGAVTLSASDVGALPSDTTLSSLPDDSNHRLVTDSEITTWNSKADIITEVNVASTGAVSHSLDAGKIYHFTGALTSLAITLNAAPSGRLAQYHFDFVEGSTAFDPTLPSGVILPDNHTWASDKRYEVDILNNYAGITSWTVG